MTGKTTKVSGAVRRAFADNVTRVLNVRFPLSPNKPKALATAAGISLSSVQRALSGHTAPTLDTVEAISTALRVDPAELIRHQGECGRTGTHC
jgi:transcriptional regulator with XRE-family HTH domain